MQSSVILLCILAIAIVGRADSVAMTACLLLLIKLLHLDNYVLPVIEKKGLFWGLVLIIASILIPIAKGNIASKEMLRVFTSITGIIALVLSLLTTYLSGLGVKYLTVQGHANVMPALLIGAIIAASFLGGVPVGPFITSGILAVIMKLLSGKQ